MEDFCFKAFCRYPYHDPFDISVQPCFFDIGVLPPPDDPSFDRLIPQSPPLLSFELVSTPPGSLIVDSWPARSFPFFRRLPSEMSLTIV